MSQNAREECASSLLVLLPRQGKKNPVAVLVCRCGDFLVKGWGGCGSVWLIGHFAISLYHVMNSPFAFTLPLFQLYCNELQREYAVYVVLYC